MYSWLSLSRPRLSRITAYLEVKIWSLPKHENLTTCKKYCGKEEKLLLRSNFSSLPQYFQNISLTSRVQLHIYLLNVVNQISFSSILQIWYVEVRISRSISESPLEFEITRVDCISNFSTKKNQSLNENTNLPNPTYKPHYEEEPENLRCARNQPSKAIHCQRSHQHRTSAKLVCQWTPEISSDHHTCNQIISNHHTCSNISFLKKKKQHSNHHTCKTIYVLRLFRNNIQLPYLQHHRTTETSFLKKSPPTITAVISQKYWD